MKRIELTQGQFALVDNEDYEELNKWKWHAYKNRYGGFAAIRNKGKWPHQQGVSMHRAVMGYPKGLQVDHRNHNTLDNRKSNLRICTNSQNSMNRVLYENTSSQYKGVYRNKNAKKWRTCIEHNGKKIHLGLFTNEVEAAKTYNKAAKELFGEFAYLNFER